MGKPRVPSPSAKTPLSPRADIAIVGGGIMGLSLAYELSRLGKRKLVLLEAGYLAGGASGRNGGGVRQQWSSALNIRLMQESIDICQGFARQMGVNIWMRQGGYLFLAKRPETVSRMEGAIALQNSFGVPTRRLEPREARDLVPDLDLEAGHIVGACYNPTDAIVFPWPFLWGYAEQATKRGVEIHTRTPVTAIERTARGFSLVTPKGRLEAERVVATTGAWSPQLTAMVGARLPTWPVRHEILSTESLKPFLRPLVSVLDSGLYFSQSLRGEIVGGIGLHEPKSDAIVLGSRLRFLEAMATELLAILPRLGYVRVVRQWAGPYDLSPDGQPILGELPEAPGFFVCGGFVGHGFMMAPVVSRHYARFLHDATPHPMLQAWRPGRFGSGDAVHDELDIG